MIDLLNPIVSTLMLGQLGWGYFIIMGLLLIALIVVFVIMKKKQG